MGLLTDAVPHWDYVDYKALKAQIEAARATGVAPLLQNELTKVDVFYAKKEASLEDRADSLLPAFLDRADPVRLSQNETNEFEGLLSQVEQLRKYVLLNYMAVVK